MLAFDVGRNEFRNGISRNPAGVIASFRQERMQTIANPLPEFVIILVSGPTDFLIGVVGRDLRSCRFRSEMQPVLITALLHYRQRQLAKEC